MTTQTEPWLVPDPNYTPTSRMGDSAQIPCVFQVQEVRIHPEKGHYIYVVQIVNELRGILGIDGQRRYTIDALVLDQFLELSGGIEGFPCLKAGELATIDMNFGILGADQDPDRENAFTFKTRLSVSEELQNLLGTDITGKDYWVLAKGVDEYFAQLG